MYRPSLKRQIIKKTTPMEELSMFDMADYFNQITKLSGELALLKKKYEIKIEELEIKTNEKGQDITKRADILNNKFQNEFSVLLQKAKYIISVIQKGDKGEQGDKGEKGDSIKGDKGEQGIQGKKGEQGDKGNEGKQGKDAVLDEKQIIAWLKNLPDGSLSISQIKNLEERLRNIASQTMLGGKGGGGGIVGNVERITVSTTAPSNPTLNDLWVDIS